MARIAGVDLPNKAVKIALTYIYGIGRTSAEEICAKTNIDPNVRINTLSADDVALLRKVIEEEYKIEGHLRTEVALNIKRLMMLSWSQAQEGPSCPRSEDQDQCPHPQGQEEDRCRKEEIRIRC